MSAHADAENPWLPGVRALLRGAVDADLPVLGVCLGAQVAAETLGGRTAVPSPSSPRARGSSPPPPRRASTRGAAAACSPSSTTPRPIPIGSPSGPPAAPPVALGSSRRPQSPTAHPRLTSPSRCASP
ncbi:glutamine amidotransferase-related protein [Actinomyces haliotis]|uniref:glutamine amidotransferase-related protein n=1 Tax=Actinomyces haliotis TaxID=1280843 RepID=UPI002264FA6B|nr:gamma-glutamyl-gamma-aminobutyrate hydrolase family protein [Actinomyces haliotis]